MCTCATAKRRRKQACNGYGHMAPLRRPTFVRSDPETSTRRLAKQLLETERRIRQGKGK